MLQVSRNQFRGGRECRNDKAVRGMMDELSEEKLFRIRIHKVLLTQVNYRFITLLLGSLSEVLNVDTRTSGLPLTAFSYVCMLSEKGGIDTIKTSAEIKV